MAIPLLAAPVVGAVLTLVSRFLMVKAVFWVISIFAYLGLAFTTNEVIVQPLLDMITNGHAGLPSDLVAWMGAFGIDKVLSILVSAYSIRGAKNVFLTKMSI